MAEGTSKREPSARELEERIDRIAGQVQQLRELVDELRKLIISDEASGEGPPEIIAAARQESEYPADETNEG